MVHALSIWRLVAGCFGAGLFNAIGTPATQSDFARWGYPPWRDRFSGRLEIVSVQGTTPSSEKHRPKAQIMDEL